MINNPTLTSSFRSTKLQLPLLKSLMNLSTKKNLVWLCAIALLQYMSIATPTQAGTTELTFTAIPDQDETKLIQRFSKVANYLEQQLDVKVNYIPVKSYAAAVTAFKNNQVQLAWFGGLSGVKARALVPNSEAIAQGFEDQFFQTFFIAHHSTGIDATKDFPRMIKDHSLTFGSKGSTSGRLMPEFFIRQAFNQKAPKDIFSQVGYSGSHSRTIALVESGAYQIGAVNFQVWKDYVAKGKVDTSKVRVIWKTPTYPDYQWTIRGDVEEQFGGNFKEKVRQALLNVSDPEILESFPRQGFVKASNKEYQSIKDTAIKVGLLD